MEVAAGGVDVGGGAVGGGMELAGGEDAGGGAVAGGGELGLDAGAGLAAAAAVEALELMEGGDEPPDPPPQDAQISVAVATIAADRMARSPRLLASTLRALPAGMSTLSAASAPGAAATEKRMLRKHHGQLGSGRG